MDDDVTIGALAIGAAAGLVAFFGKKTYRSAREAYEAGSPTASYQAPADPGGPDYAKLSYAQRWAMVKHNGFIPVVTSYAGVLPYPITSVDKATAIWEGWMTEALPNWRSTPRDLIRQGTDLFLFGQLIPTSARELMRMRDRIRYVAPDNDNWTDFVAPEFLGPEDTRVFWDGIHAASFTLNAERQFPDDAWARLWSSLKEEAGKAPATFAGWVAVAGLEVAAAAGNVAGKAAGGILAGLLGSPLGVAALVGGIALVALQELTR